MPYHVKITTDTDGLMNDAKPYPHLSSRNASCRFVAKDRRRNDCMD